MPVCATISFPGFCTPCTNPTSGADPKITMSCATICVSTGSVGGELSGSSPKQFIHTVLLTRPCYFTPLFRRTDSARSFITTETVAANVLVLPESSSYRMVFLCVCVCNLNILHINSLTPGCNICRQ